MLKFVRFLYKSGVVFLNPATFSAASSKDRGFTAIVVKVVDRLMLKKMVQYICEGF